MSEKYLNYAGLQELVGKVTKNDNKSLYHLGYCDSVEVVNGITTITRQTGYVTFNGTENWIAYGGAGANTTGAYVALTSQAEGRENLINSFGIKTQYTPYNSTDYAITIINYDLMITFPTSMFADLNAWKTYLQTNNLVVQYKLATSYTEQVPTNQPLNTLDLLGSLWLRSEWEKGLNLWSLSPIFTNTETDTRTSFSAFIYSGDTLVATQSISSVGVKTLTFTTTNSTTLTIKHSGSANDIIICLNENFGLKPNTQYTLSFNLLGYNPSVVGGLNLSNIMLNEGDHAYPYQPYYGGIVREKEFKEAINELDISKNRKLIFTGTGQNIKTVGGFSLDGAGNIPFPTAAYHAYQLTLYANGYIPVFRTNLIVSTTASSYNSGVLTKSEGLDVLTQISDEYNTDEYICQNLQPNASYWDGSQLQVTCPNATAVQYLEQQIQLDVIDNTGTSISTIYTGDIGDDSTGDYFFYLWEV